jgi:hypothetical protein
MKAMPTLRKVAMQIAAIATFGTCVGLANASTLERAHWQLSKSSHQA